MRRTLGRVLAGVLVVAVVSALALGGFLFWRDHRPQPANERVELFDGITTIRDVCRQPMIAFQRQKRGKLVE